MLTFKINDPDVLIVSVVVILQIWPNQSRQIVIRALAHKIKNGTVRLVWNKITIYKMCCMTPNPKIYLNFRMKCEIHERKVNFPRAVLNT